MHTLKSLARKLLSRTLQFRQLLARWLLHLLVTGARQGRPRLALPVRLAGAVYLAKRFVQESATGAVPWRREQRILFRREMWTAFLGKLLHWAQRPLGSRFDPYPAKARNDRLLPREAQRMCQLAELFEYRPLLSIIVPLFNTRPEWLQRLIASVQAQTYDRWELILVDDGSTAEFTMTGLAELVPQDTRIIVERLETNQGVVAATNRGAKLAHGEFLAFVDHDDELLPDALWWVAHHLQQDPHCDLIYTDEELVPEDGTGAYPVYKPDFAPESLTAYNYICHLTVLRSAVFDRVGGLRAGTDGAQDYDLLLRVTEHGCQVAHIPRVLYRWHIVPHSFSRVVDPKTRQLRQVGDIDPLTHRVVQDHLDRLGVPADCVVVDRWSRPRFRPVDRGKVSILICTRDHPWFLWRLVRSIKRRTDYPNYEIVIVDDGSRSLLGRLCLRWLQRRHRVLRIPRNGRGFNFARLNNQAVASVEADYVLFLNDDTRVLTSNWLCALVGYLQFPGVGASGARLLYPSRRVQHAGIVVGAMGWGPWHALIGVPADRNDYGGYMTFPHNTIAVTGACLLTPRELFLRLGGFDEERFAVSFNDVDYCLRLHRAGFRCVYAAQAELTHYEGKSRGKLTDPQEMVALRRESLGMRDPYWNRHYSRQSPHFAMSTRRMARRLFTDKPPHVLVVGEPSGQFAGVPHWEPLFEELQARGRCSYVAHPVAADERQWIGSVGDLLREDAFDVVFAQGPAMYPLVEESHREQVPCVWHLPVGWHVPGGYGPAAHIELLRRMQALRLPYQVIFNNRHSLALAAGGIPRDNFSVIDGVLMPSDSATRNDSAARAAVRHEWQIEDDQVALLGIFRPDDLLSAEVLLKGFSRLGRKFRRRSFLFLVGQESLGYRSADRLRRLVCRAGCRVALLDESASLDDYYAAADVFLSHATSDVRPRAVLQALKHSLPVVGTPCLQRSDLLYPGVTGLCYCPGNSASLSRALRRVIGRPAERLRLAGNARFWLESRADPDLTLESWSELLLEAAELAHAPRSAQGPGLSGLQLWEFEDIRQLTRA